MLKLKEREKKVKGCLVVMAKHPNAASLQKLIKVFDLQAENLNTWEYYTSIELTEILENNKYKKIKMSERRKRSEKKTSEGTFVDGIMVFEPHEKAPEFVIGSIVINRDKLIDWLDNDENDKFFKDDEKYGDTLTLNLNESKDGKMYLAINKYGTNSDEVKEESKPEKSSRRKK